MSKPMSEENETVSSGYLNIPIAKRHVFYISGVIQAAENYKDMIHIIRNSGQNDEIYIHINSYGGDLFSAIQIMRAMADSEATITTSVEGACMSAATMIFLAGHQYMVSDFSIFMFHNYSSGAFGKGGELYDQISHERAWSKNLLETVYKWFLTKKEIKAILDNKDIYMDADEAIKRLNIRAEKYQAKAEKKKSKLDKES